MPRGVQCVIRPARVEDIDALAKVHVRSWDETYRGQLPDAVIDGHTQESRAAQWRGWFAARAPAGEPHPGALLVAEFSDAMVGLSSVGPAGSVGDFADWELFALYVLAARQGQGIGRDLMRAAIAAARAHHAGALGFWVLTSNTSGRRFYEKGGARPVCESVEDHGCSAIHHLGYRLDL